MDVVLAEAELPDGDWRSVLEDVSRSGVRAGVIVCVHFDDFPLWLEALERGCQEVLAEPYSRDEVQRIVNSAASEAVIRAQRPIVFDRRRAAGGAR